MTLFCFKVAKTKTGHAVYFFHLIQVAIFDPIVCYGESCQPSQGRYDPLCTGVLVGKDLVLTAAQCLVVKSKKKCVLFVVLFAN